MGLDSLPLCTQVFVQDKSLYAFKGLAGKIGPIGVHIAMLLVLAGTSYSTLGGMKGSAMFAEASVCVCVGGVRAWAHVHECVGCRWAGGRVWCTPWYTGKTLN